MVKFGEGVLGGGCDDDYGRDGGGIVVVVKNLMVK